MTDSDDKNLLDETYKILQENGKTPDDVRFVCGKEKDDDEDFEGNTFGWCTWDEFAAKANEVYDSGYGSECVDREVKVVGDDWWLERHEYDGSEWWEFKQTPTQTQKIDVRVWQRESW